MDPKIERNPDGTVVQSEADPVPSELPKENVSTGATLEIQFVVGKHGEVTNREL